MSTRARYTTPGLKTSFSGVTNLVRNSPGKNKEKISLDLEEIDAYTLKREIKRPRVYNPYFVWDARKLFQIDLIDFTSDKGMVQKNGGFRYLMCVIDSFTRFLWVKAVKRKNQIVTTEAYSLLSQEFGRQPQRLLCDTGGEFVSQRFEDTLTRLGTRLIAQNRKAGTVERVQRSLQSLIYKLLTFKGNKRFIDNLPDLVRTYNTRYHRIIKMSPEEAEQMENLQIVRDNVRDYYEKALSKRKKPRFKIGDKVRVKLRRWSFTRGYQNTFTDQVYEVSAVNTVLPRPMFSIIPLGEGEQEVVNDTFYAEELQRISGKSFRRPRILRSEEGADGKLRHRVQATVGKNTRIECWFSDTELRRIRRRGRNV